MTISEFRKLVLAFESAAEHPHFEETAFQKNGKIFATLSEANSSVVLKFSLIEQEAFSAIDSKNVSPVSGYWGSKGWTQVKLTAVDNKFMNDMLVRAYQAIAKPAGKIKLYQPEFPKLGKPALRALTNAGILQLKDLGKWTEADLLRLHGMGPKTIPPLKAAMKKSGILFKKTKN